MDQGGGMGYKDHSPLCTSLPLINPYVTNELSHPYHLDEFIFILGALGVCFLFHFIVE